MILRRIENVDVSRRGGVGDDLRPFYNSRVPALRSLVLELGIVLGLPSLSVHNQFSASFGGLKHQYAGKLRIHLGYVPPDGIHRYDKIGRASCRERV